MGAIAKEKAPVASSEQNLAIRQMGAEAAKMAASKKPTPSKISTTNPLLAEKTNVNPAITDKSEGDAKKLPPVELPNILSPRSIPLPQTPTAVPKLEQQKPVHAPPSMRDDAANPALSAGPIKTTQKESSSEEEEDSDEEESDEEDSDEEDSSEEDTKEKSKVTKTQDQDPKDASAAGKSVLD